MRTDLIKLKPRSDGINTKWCSGNPVYAVNVDEVLERLALKDPELARIVELRFFAGLDVSETAKALAVSESTVKRGWATAKAWLHRELNR